LLVLVDEPPLVGGEGVPGLDVEVDRLFVQVVEQPPDVGVPSRSGLCVRASQTPEVGFDAPRVGLDPPVETPPGQLGHPLQDRGPHVELDLLGHAQVLVQELGQPVAAARPRLDGEDEATAVVALGPELDLTRLQVAVEGGKSEGGRRPGHHPHRPVPWPRHAHHELVADLHAVAGAGGLGEAGELPGRDPVGIGAHQRHQLLRRPLGIPDAGDVAPVEQGSHAIARGLHVLAGVRGQVGRGVVGQGAPELAAVERCGPPHVVPRGETDSEGPARRGEEASVKRRWAGQGSSRRL
jgi:hypothetical protein